MGDGRAEPEVIEDIRRLAKYPERVQVSERALYDLMGHQLTVGDVCVAICDWIDGGSPVEKIITQHVSDHVGKPAYVMKPVLVGKRFYVKVTIRDRGEYREKMLVISAHPSN